LLSSRRLGENYGNSSLAYFDSVVSGRFPIGPYSSGWGYYASGGLALVVLIVIIPVIVGKESDGSKPKNLERMGNAPEFCFRSVY
jgi:hypothetical protein